MSELKVKYNELTAQQFIELWETVWGDGPSLEQTELAMKHTLFRISVWDGDRIVDCSYGTHEWRYWTRLLH